MLNWCSAGGTAWCSLAALSGESCRCCPEPPCLSTPSVYKDEQERRGTVSSAETGRGVSAYQAPVRRDGDVDGRGLVAGAEGGSRGGGREGVVIGRAEGSGGVEGLEVVGVELDEVVDVRGALGHREEELGVGELSVLVPVGAGEELVHLALDEAVALQLARPFLLDLRHGRATQSGDCRGLLVRGLLLRPAQHGQRALVRDTGVLLPRCFAIGRLLEVRGQFPQVEALGRLRTEHADQVLLGEEALAVLVEQSESLM